MKTARYFLLLLALLCCISPSLALPGILDRNKLPDGYSEGHFTYDHWDRHYWVYNPRPDDANQPVIVLLHGGGGQGRNFRLLTKGEFEKLARTYGAILVYPDGIDRNWNDGRQDIHAHAFQYKIDDSGFLATLINRIVDEQHGDPSRVFVAGISNGAMMANRFACDHADMIAGIAVVAGAMPKDIAPRCHPDRPIGVIQFSGTDDPLVPYGGGEVHFGRQSRGEVLSPEKSIKLWARLDGYPDGYQPTRTDLPDTDPGDCTHVMLDRYVLKKHPPVDFYMIGGGGHTWPGGDHYMPTRIIGATSNDINATDLIWQFFMGL